MVRRLHYCGLLGTYSLIFGCGPLIAQRQILTAPLSEGEYRVAQKFKGTALDPGLYHLGTDYCVEATAHNAGATLVGTRFYSIGNGVVRKVNFREPAERGNGVGNYLVIDYGNAIVAVFMHLARVFVIEEQRVDESTLLGEAGDPVLHPSPNCPHLHLEIRKNGILGLNVPPNMRYSYASRDGTTRFVPVLGGEAAVIPWVESNFLNPEAVMRPRLAPEVPGVVLPPPPPTAGAPHVSIVAGFTMTAGGQPVNEGGTLNLPVAVNGSITVSFDARRTRQGGAPITQYLWLSNGTPIGQGPQLRYAFGTPSNRIILRVTDAAGQSSTAEAQVTLSFRPNAGVPQPASVGPPSPLLAAFGVSAAGRQGSDGSSFNVAVPTNTTLTVTFDANRSRAGTAPIVQYQWLVNGYAVASGPILRWAFATSANRITLRVVDANGRVATAEAQIILLPEATTSQPPPRMPATPVPPIAGFTMSAGGRTASEGMTLDLGVPVNGNVVVSFDAGRTRAGTSPIRQYQWLSNGTPIGSTPQLRYAFGTPSNRITLIVTDASGQRGSVEGQLNVRIGTPSAPPPISGEPAVQPPPTRLPPVAEFNLSANGQMATEGSVLNLSVPANANVTITFDAARSRPGSASIIQYQWLVNGYQVASGPQLRWAFGTSGNRVMLRVVDANGLMAAAEAQVNVAMQAAPLSTVPPPPPSAPLPVPRVSLDAGPAVVAPGGTARLTWSTTNASLCVGTWAGNGQVPTSGSVTVNPATTTTYVILCSAGAGMPSISATTTVTIAAAASVPAAPTQLTPGSSTSPGPAISSSTPTLVWSTVPGATGYGVYVRDLSTGQLVYDNDSLGSGTFLTLPAGLLVAGRSYSWNVRARNGVGYSDFARSYYFRR
jgi:hypothetical protein